MTASFQRRAKAHLAQYKQKELKIAENGVWKGNLRPYPHILPIRMAEQNILPAIRDQFWHSRLARVKLHKDFHHLNSSQALCFNLFFPYLQSQERQRLLLSSLGVADAPGIGAHFEYSPYPEEGTSIDFMLPIASGAKLLFEIKYTEQDFGKATDDQRHREKFQRIYLPNLSTKFAKEFCERATFFKHYQLLRNIWHLRPEYSDIVIFLVPRANESLRFGLEALKRCAIEPYRERVRVVFLEDLVCELGKNSPTEMHEILQQFRRKYLP